MVAVVVLQGAVDFREWDVVGTRQGPSDRPEDVAARIEADGWDRAITNGQQEYEFDPPGWPTIRLHQDCLQLWHAARMKTDCRTMQSDHDTSGARLAAVLRASARPATASTVWW